MGDGGEGLMWAVRREGVLAILREAALPKP